MRPSPPPAIASDRPTDLAESDLAKPDLAECGWRITEVCQPDGTIAYVNIPLTESEFLHPQEGYYLPNSTFHDTVAGDARAILSCRYAKDLTVGVFRDLLIEWDNPAIGDHCPDTFVAFGIQNLVIEDGQTGERLKAALELAAENQVLARAKAEAEQRAAEMAALLARYQQQFGDLAGG